MLKQLTVKDFAGVPYLETSLLMRSHKGKLKFATDKPTVIVGPNGAGKSALLDSIALRFLAYFTGASAFDDHYVMDRDSEAWWANASRWGNDWTYLQGFDCTTDNAPVAYYRPRHLPGNESNVATAMMCGYFEEAKAFARQVEKKSTGQGNQALLERLFAALKGELPTTFGRQNWRFPMELRDPEKAYEQHWQSWDHKAEVLKRLMKPNEGAVPLIVMDEPEQSLDALASIQLFRAIEQADFSKCQVIVATHSIYPLLNPQRFHIVEAEPGYAQRVTALMRN